MLYNINMMTAIMIISFIKVVSIYLKYEYLLDRYEKLGYSILIITISITIFRFSDLEPLSQADGLFIFDAPKTKQKGLGLVF